MAPSTQSKAPFALGVAQPSSNPPLAVVAMDKRRGFKGRAIDMASLEESSAIQEAGSNGLYLHLNVWYIYVCVYACTYNINVHICKYANEKTNE